MKENSNMERLRLIYFLKQFLFLIASMMITDIVALELDRVNIETISVDEFKKMFDTNLRYINSPDHSLSKRENLEKLREFIKGFCSYLLHMDLGSRERIDKEVERRIQILSFIYSSVVAQPDKYPLNFVYIVPHIEELMFTIWSYEAFTGRFAYQEKMDDVFNLISGYNEQYLNNVLLKYFVDQLSQKLMK